MIILVLVLERCFSLIRSNLIYYLKDTVRPFAKDALI